MKRWSFLAVTLMMVLAIIGCSKRTPVQTVRVPPRIDLTQHEVIGLMVFESNAEGELAALATQKFAELARRDQGLVRMEDLGSGRNALSSLGKKRWNPAAFKALATKRDIRTVFVGELNISDVRPDIQLSGSLSGAQISGQVDATLSVQMIETATGASLWNRTATATKNVGRLSVASGQGFSFDAENPEEAYGPLVEALVAQVTQDFQATWVQQ